MLDEKLIRKSGNTTIFDSFIKADDVICNSGHDKILCSVSGGSDSDIILDICEKVRGDREICYVFFDTGLEYRATKEHLKYLEERYGVKIHTIRPLKSIPMSCKEFGQPFLSKTVSENISRLQARGFQWEDESYEVLSKRYERCASALKWWTNGFPDRNNGRTSLFNIRANKLLKEFMVENPPQFKISNKCCKFTKKDVVKEAIKAIGADLDILGVRKFEGGRGQRHILGASLPTMARQTSIGPYSGIRMRTNGPMRTHTASSIATATRFTALTGLVVAAVRSGSTGRMSLRS